MFISENNRTIGIMSKIKALNAVMTVLNLIVNKRLDIKI